ncbi:hypothetical protein DL764_000261 [Monosporascus ibericus]|uniref:Uncharacterized protein n=1 Tax=Monosporascus ibericus TaxID=155417 RepID=A0A4Q4TZL9_9PEZI|nr:hypothetical protein DL764_000261 [Monosporascus ibericus]
MATENPPDMVSGDPASTPEATAVAANPGLYYTPPSSAGRLGHRRTCPFGDYPCYYPLSDHAEDLPKFLGGMISVVAIVALLIYATVKSGPRHRLSTMSPWGGTVRDIRRREVLPPYEPPAGVGGRAVADGGGRDPTRAAVGGRPPSYGTTLVADDVSNYDPRDIPPTPDNSPVLDLPPTPEPPVYIFATLFHKLVLSNKFTGRLLAHFKPSSYSHASATTRVGRARQ